MVRAHWHRFQVLTKRARRLAELAHKLPWPPNVWMGVSVESAAYEWRIDHLRRSPAAVKFLSLEPLLGPLNKLNLKGIDWAIAGGESGPNARPMPIEWVRSIRDQCVKTKVAFHFKQWGQWVPTNLTKEIAKPRLLELKNERPVEMVRLSKKLAGRILEGTTWDGVPLTPLAHASTRVLVPPV